MDDHAPVHNVLEGVTELDQLGSKASASDSVIVLRTVPQGRSPGVVHNGGGVVVVAGDESILK